MNKGFLLFLLSMSLISSAFAQNFPFELRLEPASINLPGGIQAFAFGQSNGKWLIVGGRLDGLHRRQPFAAFDAAGHNTQLWVIDPLSGQTWQSPLTSLSAGISEHLSSTNAQFHQEDDRLYFIGGYGYSNTAADHITYDKITVIDVPQVIQAIISGNPFSVFIRQYSDLMFAVTGGHLKVIGDTWYLACGNRFDGRYNPMGNPTYTQLYTDEIRRFRLYDDGTNLSWQFLNPWHDAALFHRRDLNISDQIFPGEVPGFTVFSGVFQPVTNLPYLNAVNVDSTGFQQQSSFQQHYNHYHCAHLELYEASSTNMHTVFFGGIAQFYDSAGVMIQDNEVPFVKTIAGVSRDASGNMSEYLIGELPTLMGAASEFIPNTSLPRYLNGVIKADSLYSDTTLAGYILGGINSSASNIFFINTGAQSSASETIYRVFLIRTQPTSLKAKQNIRLTDKVISVMPNPFSEKLLLHFYSEDLGMTKMVLRDQSGRILYMAEHKPSRPGIQEWEISPDLSAGIYLLEVQNSFGMQVLKVLKQ
jgi:hypothetical protein